MRTFLDCYPCFLDQALRAGRLATDDETKIKQLLDEVGAMLKTIPLQSSPPETGRRIYRKIRDITGDPDPYRSIKRRNIQKALELYPVLKKSVAKSEDRLLTAARLAIAGNVIDLGVNKDFDIEKEIEDVLQKPFAINDFKAFKYHLERADRLLYLADNAAECVFDRLLIEEIQKPVTFVVRGMPVINDATRRDAVLAGVDKVAAIVSSGTDAPGTMLDTCSPKFKELFYQSNFIISKGQGNYEALSGELLPIFFLFKAKCRVIARDLGVDEGDIIIKSTIA